MYILNTKFDFTCYQVKMLSDLYAGFGPASCASSVAQLVRASPGKVMVVSSNPTRGSQFFF